MLAPLLEEGLYLVTNTALYAALRPVADTVQVRWEQPLDDLAGEADRQVIFCALHRYSWVQFLIFGRHVPPSMHPRATGHDGLLSRAQTRAGVWLGYPLIEFRRRGPDSPRKQLIEHLNRSPGPVAFLPDSGGPYGVVKPGIIEIARETGAKIVPWAVRGRSRAFVFGRRLRQLVPLPGAELEVLRGRTLRGAEITGSALQAEIDALEERVRER